MRQGPVEVPDFLAIGHVVSDVAQGVPRLGGAAAYAALTAERLGLRAAVLTSVGPDVNLAAALPSVAVRNIPAPATTTFVNTYEDGRRRQRVLALAAPIEEAHVPEEWLTTPLVLLAPVAQEVASGLARRFVAGTAVAALQGWLREWDGDGVVRPRRWSGADVLPHVHAAVVSREDVAAWRLVARWARLVPLLAVTEGARGARLHTGGRWRHVAPFPASEVDPTGAGDVFAAAFLVAYGASRDPLASARFASAAASLCVEAPGLEGVPSLAHVEARLGAEAPGRPWPPAARGPGDLEQPFAEGR